jgi:hypothetical protein
MHRNFGVLIWSSFLKTQGPIITAASVVLWFLPLEKNLSLKWMLFVCLLGLLLVLTMANVAYESFKMSKRILPRVLLGREPPPYLSKARALLLLEPSELFSHGIGVSFYHVDSENCEQLIGIGEVINIQENRVVQVILTHGIQEQAETIEKITQNKKDLIDEMIVKPSVQIVYLDPLRRDLK